MSSISTKNNELFSNRNNNSSKPFTSTKDAAMDVLDEIIENIDLGIFDLDLESAPIEVKPATKWDWRVCFK